MSLLLLCALSAASCDLGGLPPPEPAPPDAGVDAQPAASVDPAPATSPRSPATPTRPSPAGAKPAPPQR